MIIYYRISNNSYNKKRFDYWPNLKYHCLENFLKNVHSPSRDELVIIADKVSNETYEYLCKLGQSNQCLIIRTEFGNGSATWRYVAQMAMKVNYDDQIIYFLEDDYLHLPGSREILIEGLGFANYSSGYDHPDKYINASRGGNPYVEDLGEVTKVLVGNLSHWKITNSTTMTFATTLKSLKEDWSIWDKHTRTEHPNDFGAFLELYGKGHHVVTPIPGCSTHCEFAWQTPLINWREV